MTFATVRSVALAATVAMSAFSAQALTIPTQSLQADSFQVFSEMAMDSYAQFNVNVRALGNGSPVQGTNNAFNLPVTSISILLTGGVKIENGKATGSAIEISRLDATGAKKGLTLANFTIDFINSQVLADTTVIGSGETQVQAPLYNFVKTQDLKLNYKFPLSVSLKEQLGDLRLIDVAGTVRALAIPRPQSTLALGLIPTIDFGVIDIDIGVKFRPKAVSTKAYKPAI